ncbi:hypothetical protein NEIRO03_0615 [Nematocida sp. AWRm78]|nr:hypothetical protein NEIRO02_0520 [Nematocida sp. AWRm79]KAI5182980.1 hypothetical protein NEIRO03_0615 [Nematocida sp. AWRm78]
MNPHFLTLDINPPPKVNKKACITIEKDIQRTITTHSNESTVSSRMIEAYTEFVQKLNLERTVHLAGAVSEEIQRIVRLIIEHEVKSPRLRIIMLLEHISKTAPTGINALKLLESSRNSLINRFNLYKNAYNLEIIHKNRRLFNYSHILESLWRFHREYKYFLSILMNLVHSVEKCTDLYSKTHTEKSEMLNILKNSDMYTEIINLNSRVSHCINNSTEVKVSDIKLLKGFITYYGELAYISYGVYGYGTYDLLLLFYELFDKSGNIKSTYRMHYLLLVIDMHVNQFSNKNFSTICKNTLLIKNTRIKSFLNTNYSRIRYIILPCTHKLFGCLLIHILITNILQAIFTFINSIQAHNKFRIITNLYILIFMVFLYTASIICTGYFIRMNVIIDYTYRKSTKWVIRYFTDIIIIITTIIISVIKWNYHIITKSVIIKYLTVFSIVISFIFVILDRLFRLLPIFMFNKKKKGILTCTYLCVHLLCTVIYYYN